MKLLIVILTSFMFFGCIEEGTIVYDQDYPEAPENIGGSGSGNDRVPGDGAGSTGGGTSDGSGAGSTGGSSDGNGSDGAGSTGGGTSTGDGNGSDGGDTSIGSDGGTSTSDGAGSTGGGTSDGSGAGSTGGGSTDSDGSTGGSTGGTSNGDGNGSDGGDTSSGSSDGSGSTGDGTGDGSGSGDTGGDTGSSSTGGDTSTGSDGGETGSGSSDGSGSTGGDTGSGSTGGTSAGDGIDSDGGDGVGTDGGNSGDGSGTGTGGDGGEPETNLTGITPTIKAIVDGDNIATTYNRIDGADNYTVYYSTTSPAYPSGNTVVKTNLRYTIFNPPAGERYYFQVVANAPGGNSGVSAEASAMIDIPEPPTSPIDDASTTISTEAAAFANNVSWDALDGAEGYTVYYSTSSPAFPSSFTSYVDNTTTSFIHSGLDAGTTYYYQVVATHTLGDSDASNVAYATPYADLKGVTPDLLAGAVGTDILVSWKTIDGAESYRLYYSTVAPAYPGGAAVEAYDTSYTLKQPDVETTYYFQVRAIATGGNSNISNMDDATVTIDCSDCGDPEVGAPTVTVEADVNKNVVRWDAVYRAESYNVYWNTASFPQGNTPQDVTNTTNSVFAHNALDSNKFYFYRVAAVDASNTEFFSNLVYSRPHRTECNAITPATDNDPDLLAYYAFEGNLNDSQGSYDLTTNGGGIGGYVDNCLTGTGGYFDGKGGYGYNLDFNDESVTGIMDNQWSISVWANADEDMPKFASILSTTAKNSEAGYADGWDNGFQIDVNDDREIRWFFSKTGNDPNQLNSRVALTLGEWYHIAVTYNNGTARMYVNGVERKNATGLDLGFNRLKVGVNRFGIENWKGFIDDLKVFGRTLTPSEVVEEFEGTLPDKVENVAALGLGDQIGITWDAVEGVGTYRVYYSTSGNPTVADNFFQVQNATATTYPGALAEGVTYYFRVAAVNNIGAGELSDATNESSTVISSPKFAAQGEPDYVATVDDNTKAVAIEFSPDGSKFYLIVGRASSDHKVVQYNLSTPWDVRTAASEATMNLTYGHPYDAYWTNDLVWNPDGTKLIFLNDSSAADQSRIRVYNVPTPYDLGSVVATNPMPEATFSIEVHSAVTIDHPLTFEFNSSGTKMIVGGFHSYASNQQAFQRIQEFDLAGSYDFSTITKLSATSYNTFEYGDDDAIDEVIWKADGTKFITLNLNGDVHMYSVSDRFDLSNSTITKDGLVMNLSEVSTNQVYQSINKFEGLHFNPAQNRLYYIQNSDSKILVGSMPFSW